MSAYPTIIVVSIPRRAVAIPRAIIGIVVWVPVVLISVVIMPVMGCPRIPVAGIVTPIPRGEPRTIAWRVYVHNRRPLSNLVVGCANGIIVVIGRGVVIGISRVCRVGRFGIVGLNNVVLTVKHLIAYELNHNRPIGLFFGNNNRHILLLVFININPKHNIMHI